jgi:hypothetical protein
MIDAKRKMHLAIQAAAPGHPAGWRVPGGERQAGDDVAHYQNVARICERALLDVLFLQAVSRNISLRNWTVRSSSSGLPAYHRGTGQRDRAC